MKCSDLNELYIKRKLSSTQIATLKKCTPTTILRALKREGIQVRSLSEASRARRKVTKKPIPDKLEIAYLAGIFDGEGCISIICPKKGRYLYLSCSIGTAGNYLPELFQSHFGGSISAHKTHNPHHHNSYHWIVVCSDALNLLNVIKPRLRLKKESAELAIEFQKHIIAHHGYGPHHPMGDEEKNLRSEYRKKLKYLNQQTYEGVKL